MEIKNENLHNAMRAYVEAAIEFVAGRAKQAADSSGSEDLDFYWVDTRYSSDLTEVPQYESCFNELARDSEISKHQNIGSYARGGHRSTPPPSSARVRSSFPSEDIQNVTGLSLEQIAGLYNYRLTKEACSLKSRKVTRKGLFKPAPCHGNVVLNFRRAPRAEFGPYGEAFWRSASDLAKKLASSRGYRDTDACPIVFLYRHAFELYMKAIVNCGRKLVHLSGKDVNVDGLNEHRLVPLVSAAKTIFEEMGWSWERDACQVDRVLQELDQVDPQSFTFRYPTNKKGAGLVPHHFGFNVLHFADQANGALRLLDGALTGLEEAWYSAAESVIAQMDFS